MLDNFAVAGLLAFAMPAPPGSTVLAAADPLTFCKSDMERLCPGVEPGGGRIIGYLKAHRMEMSVGCAKALQKMKAQMGKQRSKTSRARRAGASGACSAPLLGRPSESRRPPTGAALRAPAQ